MPYFSFRFNILRSKKNYFRYRSLKSTRNTKQKPRFAIVTSRRHLERIPKASRTKPEQNPKDWSRKNKVKAWQNSTTNEVKVFKVLKVLFQKVQFIWFQKVQFEYYCQDSTDINIFFLLLRTNQKRNALKEKKQA